MTEIAIYHNPRYLKLRQVLKRLHDNKLKPKVIEYLKMSDRKSCLLKMRNMKPQNFILTLELL